MGTLLEQARARLDEAARLTQVSGDFFEALKHPRQTMKATLAVPLDDGTYGFFEAWHCRHDESRGLVDGRLEIRPSITMEEIEGLALLGTIRGALLDLPFGGSAGGVCVDPTVLSAGELDRVKQCFADRLCLRTQLGDERTVAMSGFHLLQKLTPEPGSRVSIVGLGRVGRYMARLLGDAGYAIVAASDSKGSVSSRTGIPIAKLLAAKACGVLQAVCGERGVARHDGDAAVGADCDLLIAAGLPGLIHAGNARDVRARVILELADGAVDADADEILEDRGILVVPDVLAAGGGAAERHLERTPDGGVDGWTSEQIDERLAGLVLPPARTAWKLARARGISLRTAAHLLALDRLLPSHRL